MYHQGSLPVGRQAALRSNKLRFACSLAGEMRKISHNILRSGGLKNVPILLFFALRFAATTLEKLVRNLYQFRGTAPKSHEMRNELAASKLYSEEN